MWAMLPASVATSGFTNIATAASSGLAYLLPSEAISAIKIIVYLFAGFFIFGFLWKFLKKDQQSG